MLKYGNSRVEAVYVRSGNSIENIEIKGTQADAILQTIDNLRFKRIKKLPDRTGWSILLIIKGKNKSDSYLLYEHGIEYKDYMYANKENESEYRKLYEDLIKLFE